MINTAFILHQKEQLLKKHKKHYQLFIIYSVFSQNRSPIENRNVLFLENNESILLGFKFHVGDAYSFMLTRR